MWAGLVYGAWQGRYLRLLAEVGRRISMPQQCIVALEPRQECRQWNHTGTNRATEAKEAVKHVNAEARRIERVDRQLEIRLDDLAVIRVVPF